MKTIQYIILLFSGLLLLSCNGHQVFNLENYKGSWIAHSKSYDSYLKSILRIGGKPTGRYMVISDEYLFMNEEYRCNSITSLDSSLSLKMLLPFKFYVSNDSIYYQPCVFQDSSTIRNANLFFKIKLKPDLIILNQSGVIYKFIKTDLIAPFPPDSFLCK